MVIYMDTVYTRLKVYVFTQPLCNKKGMTQGQLFLSKVKLVWIFTSLRLIA